MNSLALYAALALGAISLTGCDSVTVVERHHDRRPYGYYGGRYYSGRYYGDNYYRGARYGGRYYGGRSVVVDNSGYHRGVYTTRSPRRSYVAARAGGTAIVVKDSKHRHYRHHRD